MSLTLFRAAGDSSFFNLQWQDSAGAAVNLGLYTSIELIWERPNLALITRAIVIDDGPNGLGHFVPTPAEVVEGQHFLRVKGVLTATSEEQKFPEGDPVRLIVSRALVTNV